MKLNRIIVGDCRESLRQMPKRFIHCVVTSPPYWSLRDYKHKNQLGLEKTPEEFVENLVDVFRCVRRVLRNDGIVFLNLGDTYVDKSLVGIPWMVAFALKADGWYLRNEIIWNKPNAMPESVDSRCSKCHEQIFLLTKSSKYFFDNVAIGEAVSPTSIERYRYKFGGKKNEALVEANKNGVGRRTSVIGNREVPNLRFPRSVWTINTKSFKGAHFAVFPTKLAERCILAGTSSQGCCSICFSPWIRMVEKTRQATRPGANTKVKNKTRNEIGNRDPQRHVTTTETIGWKQSCSCPNAKVVGCVVLDPFMGSGTVGLVAKKLGRSWLGCELNEEYAKLASNRISRVQEGSEMGLIY